MIETSKKLLLKNMNVQVGETVLIVTDDQLKPIGEALYQAAGAIGCESILLCMQELAVSGAEPPKLVAQAMAAADVVLCPTSKSITHTNARIEALKAGARVASMPGITEKMFRTGAITADYEQVEQLTEQITTRLTQAKTARIEKEGHRLVLDLQGREGVPSTGIYKNKGDGGNLPSGEAYIAPLENGSHGTMLIDGSMVGIGRLEEPLHIEVKDGKLVKAEGRHEKEIAILFENEQNSTLCELGIGTNQCAKLCGNILEDEKIYGTVHIAFGTNKSFGGTIKADCHMDGIILSPTVYLDDELLMKDGNFVE